MPSVFLIFPHSHTPRDQPHLYIPVTVHTAPMVFTILHFLTPPSNGFFPSSIPPLQPDSMLQQASSLL